jgi:hypothetical protein
LTGCADIRSVLINSISSMGSSAALWLQGLQQQQQYCRCCRQFTAVLGVP